MRHDARLRSSSRSSESGTRFEWLTNSLSRPPCAPPGRPAKARQMAAALAEDFCRASTKLIDADARARQACSIESDPTRLEFDRDRKRPALSSVHRRDGDAEGARRRERLEQLRPQAGVAGLYAGQPLAEPVGIPPGPRRDRGVPVAQVGQGTRLSPD